MEEEQLTTAINVAESDPTTALKDPKHQFIPTQTLVTHQPLRVCYKCGNSGHHPAVCRAQVRFVLCQLHNRMRSEKNLVMDEGTGEHRCTPNSVCRPRDRAVVPMGPMGPSVGPASTLPTAPMQLQPVMYYAMPAPQMQPAMLQQAAMQPMPTMLQQPVLQQPHMPSNVIYVQYGTPPAAWYPYTSS
jgi:hypothetical protein